MTNGDRGYGSAGVGWAEGEFRPIGEMAVPVTDMGFQLADMCYDAVHVWNGRFFRLDDHLDRFEWALGERRYDLSGSDGGPGLDRGGIARILHGCVARAGLEAAMVTLLATRGRPQGARKDLRTATNRFMAWAVPFHGITSEAEMAAGADVIIPVTVRIPPESVDPRVKNFGRLDFVRALYEAYERDADYALLLDTEGFVTEGRGWNVFALKGGRLVSPDRGVLEGITRRTVIELAERLNVEAGLGRLTADDMKGADEAFMTSTAGGIMPIRAIDGQVLGDGAPGPVTQRLTRLYWELHDDPAFTTAVDYGAAAI